MFGYIIGCVKYITANHIIIENNGIGYIVYVANPYAFEADTDYTIFVYQSITEYENCLYGFKTMEEKELFLKLINVKGLGPKTALPMFASGSVGGIIDAIERENILYLTKFPKVGDKLARQIILDLKGKINMEVSNNSDSSELVEVLINLGYKQPDIKKIIPKINSDDKLENQIKEALKLMLR